MIKVSILVAVYNGEKFLRKCLQSLVEQTYENIEIVCIDDGSKDKSVDVITEMMAQDERIKLIKHNKNKGLAEAWNTGVNAATGDIIGYLDCDDWYDEDTIEKLIDVFDKHDDADCVLYKCVYVSRDGRESQYEGKAFESMTGKEAFLDSLSWNIHGIYAGRAELYRKFPIDTTRRHFSNDNTTRIHYYMSRRVYQSEAKYYYLYNPDSITNQVSTSRMDYLAATQSMKRQLEALNCSKEIMRTYENERLKILVDCYLFYFKYRDQLSNVDRKYCLEELRTDWETIDNTLLDKKLSGKLGYKPFKGNWHLFRLQEELYFLLKKITGRL